MRIAGWALAAVLLVPAAAGGAESEDQDRSEPGEHVIREEDRVVVKKTTNVDFNDVELEGELINPEGGYVRSRPQSHFESLIKMRKDFNKELEESVDE